MRDRRLLVVGIVLVVASLAAVVGSSATLGTSFSRGMGPMHGGPMMGWRGSTGGSGSASEIPGARPVEVEAVDLAFRPGRIEATAGEAITIELTNTGRVLHDFSIPGFRIVAGPGETARGSVVVDEPGEYRFLCTVPGHAEAGMVGVLVVTG